MYNLCNGIRVRAIELSPFVFMDDSKLDRIVKALMIVYFTSIGSFTVGPRSSIFDRDRILPVIV